MRLLFGLIFIDLLGFGIIVPLLPFMALRLEAGPKEVTYLVATYSAALLLAMPVWGRLSDRIGRKPVLLLAFAGTGTAFVIMAFADHLWMLFVARGLAGLLSGDMAAAPAYVADITPENRRAKSLGILGAAFGLAFTIGPGIGATLVGTTPDAEAFRTIPLISAGLSLTALVLGAIFLPESLKRRREQSVHAGERFAAIWHISAFRFPHMGVIIATVFLISAGFSAMEATLPLWSEAKLGWGPREVGYLFVFAGLVAVICQGGLVGPLTRRLGEARLLIVAAVLLLFGMGAIAIADDLGLLLAGVGALAAGFGFGNPALQSLVTRLSAADATGGALGIAQSTSSIARVAGPPGAGLLFELQGPSSPYLAGSGLMAGVVAISLVLAARLRGEPALAETPEEALSGDEV
jgi:MFS family permease